MAADKIFSQSRAPQRLPRISPGQACQGVFSTFHRKKKSAKILRTQGSELGARLELMDAVSLAGVSSVAQHGVRLLLLVAEIARVVLTWSAPLVHPLTPVAWSSCWCRLCLATSPSWRLLEEFPLLRALRRAIRTWKSGLRLRPRTFQSFGVWVLPLEYVVFGTRALLDSTVDTCSTRGFWRTSHIFSVW